MILLPPANLAALNPLRNWSEFQRLWQDRSSLIYQPLLPVLLVVLAVISVLLAGLWLWERRRQRTLRARPISTFHQVAREMGLSIPDQWLLSRIAHAAKLPTPLTLLLSPATLLHHANPYVRTLPRRRVAGVSSRVDRIRAMLTECR